MGRPAAAEYYAEISGSAGVLADIAASADLAAPVPTCPDWTLRQLLTHVGRAHRWAAAIVATRSDSPIPFRDVPGGRFPDDPGERPGWLREGAELLTGVLRTAGGSELWTHAGPGPASYWARRMAHESSVHRADAEIALGREPVISAVMAADGIGEWLGFLTVPGPGGSDPRLDALGDGQVLHVHASDEGLDGAGEWLVRRDGDAVTASPGHGKGDVALRGPASELFLVLLRRLPAGAPGVEVLGDRGLLDAWLAATSF